MRRSLKNEVTYQNILSHNGMSFEEYYDIRKHKLFFKEKKKKNK